MILINMETGEMGQRETLLGNTSGRESNPVLIAAQILENRGLKIRTDSYAYKSGPQRGQTAIYGSPKAGGILNELSRSQEFKILNSIADPDYRGLSGVEEAVASSQWDEEAKKDVLILWLHKEAASDRKFKLQLVFHASPGTDIVKEQGRWENRAQEKEARAKEIGGSIARPTRMTTDKMRSLVEKLVNRKLQPPRNSSRFANMTPPR